MERLGCDPSPLDPASAADRLTLTSYVWADQVDRFERLRAALRVAATHPLRVERLPATQFLERELAAPQPGVVTVVWHSVVRQYLDAQERGLVAALLDAAGARASRQAPLAHLALEPEQVGAGSDDFRVVLRTWPGGDARPLADCQGHGPPFVWR